MTIKGSFNYVWTPKYYIIVSTQVPLFVFLFLLVGTWLGQDFGWVGGAKQY